jgi:hypothetical protein
MDEKTMRNQIASTAIAYLVFFSLCWTFDAFFLTCVSISLIIWINLGVMLMALRQADFRLPDKRYIDVIGGLHMLLDALIWPVRI